MIFNAPLMLIIWQVVPMSKATQQVRKDRGYAVNELVFQAQAPPLGYSTYFVSVLQNGPPSASVKSGPPAAIQNKVSLPPYLQNCDNI